MSKRIGNNTGNNSGNRTTSTTVQTKTKIPKIKIPMPVKTKNNMMAMQSNTIDAIAMENIPEVTATVMPSIGNKSCHTAINANITTKTTKTIFFVELFELFELFSSRIGHSMRFKIKNLLVIQYTCPKFTGSCSYEH